MKKQLISTMFVVSALAFASAQSTATTTPPVLPPAPVTGDVSIDAQIRSLNKEMEAKIKAIRDEYQTKLKVLIGNRKAFVASSTERMREERKAFMASTTQQMKDKRGELKNEIKGIREEVRGSSTPRVRLPENSDRQEGVRGTSTEGTSNNLPQGKAWGFMMRFFGAAKPGNTQ